MKPTSQWKNLLQFIIFIGVTFSCGTNLKNTEEPEIFFQDITVTDAEKLIRINRNNTDFIIIDVRTPKEFKKGHIADAVNMNYRNKDFEKQLEKLDTARTYLIYCRGNNRSGKVFQIMKTLPFSKVYKIQGGFVAWKGENYPVAEN